MNSAHPSFDARENLVRRIGLAILVVAVAIDLLLRQMNLESSALANILTVIEFLAIGLLVWVFLSRRQRQIHQSKNRHAQPPKVKPQKSVSNEAKEPVFPQRRLSR